MITTPRILSFGLIVAITLAWCFTAIDQTPAQVGGGGGGVGGQGGQGGGLGGLANSPNILMMSSGRPNVHVMPMAQQGFQMSQQSYMMALSNGGGMGMGGMGGMGMMGMGGGMGMMGMGGGMGMMGMGGSMMGGMGMMGMGGMGGMGMMGGMGGGKFGFNAGQAQ